MISVFTYLVAFALFAVIANILLARHAATLRKQRRERRPPKANRPYDYVVKADPEDPPAWTLDNLQALEWRRFEIVCVAFLRHLGFDAHETCFGADGGVDIKLHKDGIDTPVGVCQCKAWKTRDVGVQPVRELFGVMAAAGVPNGVFMTTSAYTEEARRFAHGQKLELISGRDLIAYIQSLSPERQTELAAVAFEGDYSNPTCPSCNIKMVLRTAKRGWNPGSSFWACPTYRCRRKFPA